MASAQLVIESIKPLSNKSALKALKVFLNSSDTSGDQSAIQKIAKVPDEVVEKIKFMVNAMEEESQLSKSKLNLMSPSVFSQKEDSNIDNSGANNTAHKKKKRKLDL